MDKTSAAKTRKLASHSLVYVYSHMLYAQFCYLNLSVVATWSISGVIYIKPVKLSSLKDLELA